MAKKKRAKQATKKNGANLGFEATLWLAADKLRNIMDAAEYTRVCLDSLRNWEVAGKIRALRHPWNNYRLYRPSRPRPTPTTRASISS
ncbi:MAG: hypothetical protein HQ567_33355 [Candidatus Nealsonbacteria bacterium]|nr:hypothetical protein [Candidatus Nealsonbacteria bacterium]